MEDLSREKEESGLSREAGFQPKKKFLRQERLKGRDEIREVFKRGGSLSCSGAKLFILKNKLPHNRIAFTFSRKFGNAVERNRARRVGREAYRHLRASVQGGYDLVLLVYPGRDTFRDRTEQLRNLFSRAGLIKMTAGGKKFT